MSSYTSRTLSTATLTAILALCVNSVAVQAATDAPVYPGAVASARPAGLGLKTHAPPASAKTYRTSDSFAKVKAWYQAHLKGAQEMQQSGMENYEDAFLIGNAPSGMVVMVEAYQGSTWIIIGPPV